MFAPKLNSTVMLDCSSREVDIIARIPSMPLIADSSGSVIWFATTSAFAPVYVVRTSIMGGSMAGYSRTPTWYMPIAPKSTMSADITSVKTGLLMLVEAMLNVHFLVFDWNIENAD
jgi:hypothetical protein